MWSLRKWITTFRLHTAGLLQAMRSIEHTSLIDWMEFHVCGWRIFGRFPRLWNSIQSQLSTTLYGWRVLLPTVSNPPFSLSLNCIQLIDVHRSVKFWKNVYIRFRTTLTYQKLRWLWPVYADFQRDTSWCATPEHANKTGHHPLWNEVKFIDRDSHW